MVTLSSQFLLLFSTLKERTSWKLRSGSTTGVSLPAVERDDSGAVLTFRRGPTQRAEGAERRVRAEGRPLDVCKNKTCQRAAAPGHRRENTEDKTETTKDKEGGQQTSLEGRTSLGCRCQQRNGRAGELPV